MQARYRRPGRAAPRSRRNGTGVAGDRENPATLLGQTGAAMRKLAFSRVRALCIQNASLVLLGSPIDSDEPKDLLLGHRRFSLRQNTGSHYACRYCTGARRRELPAGNPPWPTRRGTRPLLVLVGTGSRKVAPGGSARAVSLISKATGRLRNGTGIKERKQAVALTRLSYHQ